MAHEIRALAGDPFNTEDFVYGDSYVHFSGKQFLKMLLYHAVMMMFSPLIGIPVIVMVERSFVIIRNMGFWGFN